jgi:HD-GYP domain-containing protein (c-di-GMP phosphodiesterase class II)
MIDAVARQLEVLLPHDGFAMYTYDAERQRLTTVMVRGGKFLPGLLGTGTRPGPDLGGGQRREPLLITMPTSIRARSTPAVIRSIPAGASTNGRAVDRRGRTIGSVCLAREGSVPFTPARVRGLLRLHSAPGDRPADVQLVERNRSIHISTIRALTAIIDTKDPLTAGHSGASARSLAAWRRQLGASAAEQRTIELAGLLHDIGKVGIPDDILAKPGPLTSDQRAVMQAHRLWSGHSALDRSVGLAPMIPLVRHHHERFDGGGYPDGIAGSDIPFGAAVIAVAETFDMLTTERPYRAAETPLDALAEIQRNAGGQFHPLVVVALDAIVRGDAYAELACLPRNATRRPAGSSSPVEIRSIAVLHRIASEISTISDLDAFLENAARIISELQYENVDILLPSDSGAHLVVRGRVAVRRTG